MIHPPKLHTIAMWRLIFMSVFFSLTNLSGQDSIKENIYFNYNAYNLTDSSKLTLNGLFNRIQLENIIEVKLVGYADSDGHHVYNDKLSKDRAISVANYLVTKGIKNELIDLDNRVEGQAGTYKDQQKNRRVEISIRCVVPSKTNTQPLSDSIKKEVVIEDNRISQTFTVSPAKDILIRGRQGTELNFAKNSFVDQRGNMIRADVVIELKEILSKSDMIINRIQTVSDGKLLETGGMIFVKVTSKNKAVFLRTKPYEASYYVELPTKQRESGMFVFYGDSIHPANNWHQGGPIRNSFGDGPVNDTLKKYIFPAAKLGWINCDRFAKVKNVTNLYVNLTDTTNTYICLVFKDLNAVLSITRKKSFMYFPNIPVDETATVIVFSKGANGIRFFSREVIIAKNQKMDITDLEDLSVPEFEERIKQFN